MLGLDPSISGRDAWRAIQRRCAHRPQVRGQDPRQPFQDRGLAASRWPHQAGRLACRHAQRKVAHHGLVCARRTVGHGQIFQGQVSGRSGLLLPPVSLGLWHNFGAADDFENARRLIHGAFDAGITYFDLANNYGPPPGSAEECFGRIFMQDLSRFRDELVIATKAGHLMWPGPYGDWGSRKHMLASLDQSLSRMKLDYVDIFYHHRMDPETPLEETMGALASAVQSGKALYVGLSNYDGPTLEKAEAILRDLKCPFVINQNRYSIFDRTIEKNGLKDTAKKLEKGIIAFSPLAQGLLTDRYLKGIPEDSRIMTDGRFLKKSALTEEKLVKIRELNGLAAGRGQTLAEMALSWILKDGIVTSVLVGASKPEQVLDNIKAIQNTEFTEEELRKIDELSLV